MYRVEVVGKTDVVGLGRLVRGVWVECGPEMLY